MIWIIGFVVVLLVLLIATAVFIIIGLLKRVDTMSRIVVDGADRTLMIAETHAKAAPKQIEKMLESLAASTTQMYAAIESTMKSVLSPVVVQVDDTMSGGRTLYPHMSEGEEAAPWDHTDRLIAEPPRTGVSFDPGYEHEASPDFDPDNPFGLPHIKQGTR